MSPAGGHALKQYRALIEKHVPDLEIHSLRANSSGWGSRVFEVNGEWIFRFPRSALIRKGTERALQFYPFLARIVPVAIPDNVYHPRNRSGELLFVGYPKLHGKSLPEPMVRGAAAQTWARGLAEVLKALARVSLSSARAAKVPERDPEAERRKRIQQYRRVRESIWPLLSVEEKRRDRAAWDSCLGDPDFRAYQPGLVHGDLYASHILTGPSRTGVTAILDWEDAAIGDPAGDLAVIPSEREFSRRVWSLSHGDDEELWHRARVRRHWAYGGNLEYWLAAGRPDKVRDWTHRYVDSIPV